MSFGLSLWRRNCLTFRGCEFYSHFSRRHDLARRRVRGPRQRFLASYGEGGGSRDAIFVVFSSLSSQEPITRPLLTLLRRLWHQQTGRIKYRIKAAWENKSSHLKLKVPLTSCYKRKNNKEKKKNWRKLLAIGSRPQRGSNGFEVANLFPTESVSVNNGHFMTCWKCWKACSHIENSIDLFLSTKNCLK